MSKKILAQHGVTKVDIINAESSRSFRDLVGAGVVAVRGAALVEEVNADGNAVTFPYVFTEDGEAYGGNSATIRKGVEGLIDLMDDAAEGEHYGIEIESRQSNNAGHSDFLMLKVRAI